MRGIAPILSITELPFDTGLIKSCRVCCWQNNDTEYIKTDDDVTIESDMISVQLSQEETIALDESYPLMVQFRILLVDETPLVSDVYYADVKELHDEVLMV